MRTEVLSENLKRRDHLEDLGLDGRIILEWMIAKWFGKEWTGLSWLRLGITGQLL
jgi:hypothetical protein